MPNELDPAARAETILEHTKDAYERGDVMNLQHYASMLLSVVQQIGDPRGVAQAYNYLGTAEVYRGNADAAKDFSDEALIGYRSCNDRNGIVRALIGRAVIEADMYLAFNESRKLLSEALEIARADNDDSLTAFALANLAETERLDGDYAGALVHAQSALLIFEQGDDQAHAAAQLTNIAHYHALRREHDAAMQALREAYKKLRRNQRYIEIARYLEIWFFLAFELRRFQDAATLLGFIETYRDEHSVPRLPAMMPWYAPRLERLEKRLGYEELARLRRQGERLTLAQVNALTDSF